MKYNDYGIEKIETNPTLKTRAEIVEEGTKSLKKDERIKLMSEYECKVFLRVCKSLNKKGATRYDDRRNYYHGYITS